jgi:hypothetical protein
MGAQDGEGSVAAAIEAGAGPSPHPAPAPLLKPIAPVQDADQRSLSFPRGLAPGTRLSPEFVREIGRFAYLWAWPLVNVFNRYNSFKRVHRPLLIGGIAPVAPINHLAMLHDHIGWKQRYITSPSQDLVYGFGIFDLGREPVVVQVPDFGNRYWVYQATDLRTDGFWSITLYNKHHFFAPNDINRTRRVPRRSLLEGRGWSPPVASYSPASSPKHCRKSCPPRRRTLKHRA